MRMKVAVLATVVLAALGVITACSSEKVRVNAAPEWVPGISLLEVRPAELPDRFEAAGTVQASESAALAAQIMATVAAVNAHEGDHVRRGQVLVVLDAAQPRAGFERAQASLSAANHEAAAAESEYALASATNKRYQDLFEKKAASAQEFDEVKARMQGASARRELAHAGQAQARAALAEAQTMLGYTAIRAPFDGVVTSRRVDPGALAVPGAPLLTVEKGGRFRLQATVDESSLSSVKLGQSVTVRIDALGDGEVPGKIVEIVPAADAASRSFTVKIELPANLQLRSGFFGRAYFSRGERASLVVPRTAVIDRGQLQGVYVVGSDHLANLRYVTLGKSAGEQVEVLSGLQAGDRLVAAPGTRDLGGKRVE